MIPNFTKPSKAARKARDRRRSVVEKATDLFGLDHARLERRESGDLVLQLHFIPSSDRESGRPPGLKMEHIRLMSLESGTAGTFGIEQIIPGQAPWVSELILESRGTSGGRDENGIFQVRIVGRKDIDPHFSAVDFGVGVSVHTMQINRKPQTQPSHLPPPTNYLYKDEESFRGLMLDRLGRSVPGWQERAVPDIGIALTEAIAHASDFVSYYQDAVGTEAYIDTARQRQSIRRHGRLVDVSICDGAGARTWLAFQCTHAVRVPAGVTAGTSSIDTPVHGELDAVFRTTHDAVIHPEQNIMTPHCWGMAPLSVPAGSTVLAIQGHISSLAEGSMVAIETPSIRHAVRICKDPLLTLDDATGAEITIIHWAAKDALPIDIIIDDRTGSTTSRVVGNLILAQQGQTVEVPAQSITTKNNSMLVNLRGHSVLNFGQTHTNLPASQQRQSTMGETLPDMLIAQNHASGRQTQWQPVRDLMSSSPVDTHFVVERDNQGRMTLRFGDGQLGRPMPNPKELTLFVGIGKELAGNVAEDSLVHIHSMIDGLTAVRNPVQAVGGREAESLEAARRRVMRGNTSAFACIEPADFARIAKNVDGVRDAVAISDWAGTWPVVTIYVLSGNTSAPVESTLQEVQRMAELHRRIGVKVEVFAAPVVHLDLEFVVSLRPDAPLIAVESLIRQTVGGHQGLFQPDQWGFGDCPFESQVIQAISKIDGVLWTETLAFRRRDRSESGPAIHSIEVGVNEVIAFDQRHFKLRFEVVS